MQNEESIKKACDAIRHAKYAIAFTGAGISLESGVPTFRGGADSIWSKYDAADLEIGNFMSNPKHCWETIRACFYDFMRDKNVQPNFAHKALADMEKRGIIKAVITQNIDGLHQRAGSSNVLEFHGSTETVSCVKCGHRVLGGQVDMSVLPPHCPQCGGLMKPDFVFFGEGIPSEAYSLSMEAARAADLCIVVGTTAEVMPAGMIPVEVHRHGGTVIEINPSKSAITDMYADVHIGLGAVEAFNLLVAELD